MSDSTTTIYTLSDPETGEVRYIGKTAYPLDQRLKRHFYSKEKNHRTNWIRSLLMRGLRPVITAIEEGIVDNWVAREQYWISYYKSQGARLVNLTDGGEGAVGCVRSQEYRKKRSEIAKVQFSNPEARAKISAAKIGKRRSPETIEKMRAASTGKKQSIESKLKKSASMKARWEDDEYRTKTVAARARIGVKHTVESNIRRSIALKGRVFSAESIIKMRISHLKHIVSPGQLKLDFGSKI